MKLCINNFKFLTYLAKILPHKRIYNYYQFGGPPPMYLLNNAEKYLSGIATNYINTFGFVNNNILNIQNLFHSSDNKTISANWVIPKRYVSISLEVF